jgi:hypothetical protein
MTDTPRGPVAAPPNPAPITKESLEEYDLERLAELAKTIFIDTTKYTTRATLLREVQRCYPSRHDPQRER